MAPALIGIFVQSSLLERQRDLSAEPVEEARGTVEAAHEHDLRAPVRDGCEEALAIGMETEAANGKLGDVIRIVKRRRHGPEVAHLRLFPAGDFDPSQNQVVFGIHAESVDRLSVPGPSVGLPRRGTDGALLASSADTMRNALLSR